MFGVRVGLLGTELGLGFRVKLELGPGTGVRHGDLRREGQVSVGANVLHSEKKQTTMVTTGKMISILRARHAGVDTAAGT